MSPLQNCVLCNQTVKEYERQASSTIYYARCDVCGKYKSESFNDEVYFSKLPIEDKAMISAYTRELYEYEAPIPELHTLADEEKIERIIERFRKKTVIEKLNNLILYVGKRSHYFKEPFRIDGEKDYPITYSVNKIEFDNIRGQAEAAKLVSLPITGGNVQLEWAGWERFEAIKNARVLSKRCFVAMSCSNDLSGAYEHGIKPAVKEAGYDPIFIEREEHNEKICDLIIAEIRSCKFVIADVTGQRQNVYYEAGFAHGLGRDVIWTCRRDEMDSTHFDTRQYNHIFWENEEDLKKKLINRIKATIL